MARNLYGAGTTDYAVSSTGAPVAGATLTVYTAPGGTLITDLLTVADNLYTPGGAITFVTTTATGQYPFYGPDGENGTLYVQSTVGGVVYWYGIDPTNLGDDVQGLAVGVGPPTFTDLVAVFVAATGGALRIKIEKQTGQTWSGSRPTSSAGVAFECVAPPSVTKPTWLIAGVDTYDLSPEA